MAGSRRSCSALDSDRYADRRRIRLILRPSRHELAAQLHPLQTTRIIAPLALFGCLTSSGCTFARAEINDYLLAEKVEKYLVLGETTQVQLIEGIGTPPGQVILLPRSQKLLVYNYGQTKTKGLTLILFNIAKTNVAIDTAIFLIDEDGKVAESWVGDNSLDVPWEWWAFGK